MRGKRVLSALLAIAAVLAGVVVVVAMAAPSTAALDLSYPPNSKQLIAAGLAARPPRGSAAQPVAVDLVLTDGIQTTVLYHLPQAGQLGFHAVIPLITLVDNRGRVYQPRSASMGTGPVTPPGLHGGVDTLFRMVAFFTGHMRASGYAVFDPLSPHLRAATLSMALNGAHELVRVPLRLAALARLSRTVVLHRRVARRGMIAEVARVTRAPGRTQIAYTVDAPFAGLSAPTPDVSIVDARGRALPATDGSSRCGASAGRPARLRCAGSIVIAAPARGTRLWLRATVYAPARVVIAAPFRMP